MVIEDILSYPNYMECLHKIQNGECFRKEFSYNDVKIALEQSNYGKEKLKMLTVYCNKDSSSISLENEINYKELIKEISVFLRNKTYSVG